MKNLLHTILIAFLFSTIMFCQQGRGPGGMDMQDGPPMGKGAMKKIRELERVKLIEALNLNEETTLKFFARRNQHQNDLRDLENHLDNILDAINAELENKDINENKIKKLTDDFFNATTEIHKAKTDFLLSLKDILTTDQIARLIVFERNFREEMREILMKERFRRRGNQ